ncbi:MAG: dihydrodipicolinate synthase family protein [Candidatus Latescibacterota bacterium]|jgi:4-hydroxy-tetrahydrodipicolinate synthase
MSELKQADCATVLIVAITPRSADGSIDLLGAAANVRYLVESGANFIMPMCGTGLVYDATLEEYEAVVGTFMDAAAGKAFIVPGIGPGYGRTLEMGKIARSLGVAGAMVMPIVGPASAKGVEEGMTRIARDVQLPLLLYQRRLDIMPVAQVIRLCALDEVIGLKYAVDDLYAFTQINDAAGTRAAMVCGMAEDPALKYLAAGAVGFSSGMANFAPRMSLAILQNSRSDNRAAAEVLREVMVPFEDLRGERAARYSGSALHAAMERARLAGGPVVPFAEDVAEGDLPHLHLLVDRVMEIEKTLLGNGEGNE